MKPHKLAPLLLSLLFVACNDGGTNQTTGGNTNAAPTPAASPQTAANANNKPPADEFARAVEIYGQNCVACHGENYKGGTVTVEGKKLKVPSLLEGHALKHTEEQFTKQIADGGDGMPAFKERLKPDEMSELSRFIRQRVQAGVAGSSTTPGPAKR